MIRVTIDIVPGGDEAEKHTVREIEISNVTRRDDLGGQVHTYEAIEMLRDIGRSEWFGKSTWIRPAPRTFQHNRSDGLEACVRRALVALYGGEG